MKKLFQTKRKPAKGQGFKILPAKTRKRKQRVSAAATGGEFIAEEPNLGVARALVVILLLHIAAIAAIAVHNQSTKDNLVVAPEPSITLDDQSPQATVAPSSALPVESASNEKLGWRFVYPGDTYSSIAASYGIDEAELRRLNSNEALKVNSAIRVPAEPVKKASLASVDQLPSIQTVETTREELPPVQPEPVVAKITEPVLPEVVEPVVPQEYEIVAPPEPIEVAKVEQEPVVPKPEPTIVQEMKKPEPVVEKVVEPEVAVVVPEVKKPEPKPEVKKPVVPQFKTYTVKKGDTIWGIAKKHGISPAALLKANGNPDPRKIGIGKQLKIPN